MTVDKLGENKVLIILCNKDMEDYRLDYDTMSLDDIHSRKILMRIMQTACFKTGIEITGKSIKLEAMGLDDGCYILITIKNQYTDRSFKTGKYRIKKSKDCLCYLLGTGGEFLDTIEMLYRQNVCCNRNCAYMYNNEYYLIFDYPAIPRKLKKVLTEYGKKRGGKAFAARIRENGKELCSFNAIAQIGRHLV